MDEAAAPIRLARSPGQRMCARAYESLPLLVCLLAVAFLSVRVNKGIYLGDEGVACMAGWRIAQGQTPVADFFQIETPLSTYTLGMTIKALGATVGTSRLLGFLYGLLLISLAHALAKAFLCHPVARASALAFLIPFGVGAWPFASHHWAVDLWLMLALWLLAQDAPSWKLAGPVLGGAAAAAGALCLQDQGGYALLAVAILAPMVLPSGQRLFFLGSWVGGAATVSVAALAFLLRDVSLHTMVQEWVLFPIARYGGLQGSMWAEAGGWREVFGGLSWGQFATAPLYILGTILSYALLFALPGAALVAGALCIRNRWLAASQRVALCAVALAFAGGAAHRWSIMNLVWAAPVLAILAAMPVDQWWDSHRTILRVGSRWTAGAILAVLCAFGATGIIRQSSAHAFAIRAPAGTLHTFDPRQAAALQPFIDAIQERVPGGAPAFMWGYIPLVNFLTGHPNPTRYNILLTSPPYNTPAQVRDWMDGLEGNHVQWGFSHAFPVGPNDPVAPYLAAHYDIAWTNSTFTLWRRKDLVGLPR
jgi:hypothetical protein